VFFVISKPYIREPHLFETRVILHDGLHNGGPKPHPLLVIDCDCVVNQYASHAQDFSGEQHQVEFSFVIFGRILVCDFFHWIRVARGDLESAGVFALYPWRSVSCPESCFGTLQKIYPTTTGTKN